MGRFPARTVASLVVLGFLTSDPGQAKAEFILVKDQAAFNTNDTAPWSGQHLFNPLTSQVFGGMVNWSERDQSIPFFNTLVTGIGGTLFIGTAVTSGPGTAFFDLNMNFDFHGLSAAAVGAVVQIDAVGNGTTLLTAHDVKGNSRTFDLGSGSIPRGFLGVISDEAIISLELFSSHTGTVAESALTIGPLDFHVVPTPPGLVLAGIGGLSLVGYGWRRRSSK
jgi:hypothetical protein